MFSYLHATPAQGVPLHRMALHRMALKHCTVWCIRNFVLLTCKKESVVHPRDAAYWVETVIVSHADRW